MNKTYLLPYKMGSAGAKELSRALGIKRVRKEGSKFRPRANKTVINWGNGSLPAHVKGCQIINQPEAVNKAGNKLLTFQSLGEWNNEDKAVNIPEWTTDSVEATEWMRDGLVVARTVLRGHSGAGIELCDEATGLVEAPLYVKYVKKTHEFRVHILGGKVIDQQRKARKKDVADEDVNWKIRNHDNGFIFMREGVDLPEVAIDQAAFALEALDLDFGAVDLIYNEKQDKYYVLEINTAPGLTGTTLDNYVEAFNDYLR